MKQPVDAWDTVDRGDLIYDQGYDGLNCMIVIPDFEAVVRRNAPAEKFSALGKRYMTAPERGDALVSSFNLAEPA